MTERPLVHQVSLFAVVGAAATLIHVAAALTAREAAGLAPLQANLAGYLCAVGASYFGNAWLTFRRPVMHGPQFVRFLVVSLAGLALTQALTWLLVQRLGWPFWAGLAVVAVATPALSFILQRTWAFGLRS
ncbi:MAG: GtrA family protein [Phenylobacterium sp.]|uniref:GtrA family protein n=1 Tax=Phenylobacterium sp. TaxID=1871053 RepID=UPI001A5AD2B8|nr:GtrA family protein [Phenylobacterium sp.]MBL8770517.1 GtrA family protein [Phenylobacterium sp.]